MRPSWLVATAAKSVFVATPSRPGIVNNQTNCRTRLAVTSPGPGQDNFGGGKYVTGSRALASGYGHVLSVCERFPPPTPSAFGVRRWRPGPRVPLMGVPYLFSQVDLIFWPSSSGGRVQSAFFTRRDDFISRDFPPHRWGCVSMGDVFAGND